MNRPLRTLCPLSLRLLPMLLLSAGCVPSPFPLPPTMDTVSDETAKIPLGETLRLVKTEQLAAETVESLRQIAGEYRDNHTLLRLPGIVREFRSGTEFPPERLLDLLDNAIAYHQLLAIPPGSDMEDERRPRIAQLLALSTAENWVKLAAAREKIALSGGGGAPELRQEEADLRLELRMATNLSRSGIDGFDFTTLAEPRLLACDLARLQRRAVRNRSESALPGFPAELPGRIRLLPGMENAEIPRMAELLYRLPRRLAERQLAAPNSNHRLLAALASGAGVAFEVEYSLNRLRAAWERFDLARRKAELYPETGEFAAELIDARRDWRLAYYRLLTDLAAPLAVPFDETAEPENGVTIPPEITEELLVILQNAEK